MYLLLKIRNIDKLHKFILKNIFKKRIQAGSYYDPTNKRHRFTEI
jgi:hypothetical protein